LANQGYNPNEPRLPAGQPGGGQWTSAPSTVILPGGNRWTGPAAGAPAKDANHDYTSKTLGKAAKETAEAFLSGLASLLRGTLFPSEPDREPSEPKNIFQLAKELDEAADDIDMTKPKGLGHAMAAGAAIVAGGAISEGAAESSGPSARAVSERGPQAVIEQLSSDLKNGTLSAVQTRDWYNSTTVTRADIIDNMRAAGYSDEEIAQEAFDLRNALRTKARDLMTNAEVAAKLEKENPNLTWDEIIKKYNSDYNIIIQKSLESNEEINKQVDQMRQKRQNETGGK